MRKYVKIFLCLGFMIIAFIKMEINVSSKHSELPKVDTIYRTPYRHQRVQENKIIGITVAVLACAGSIIYMYRRGYKIQMQYVQNGIQANTSRRRRNKRIIHKRIDDIAKALQDPLIIHDEHKLRCYVTKSFYEENENYFNEPLDYKEIELLEIFMPQNELMVKVKKCYVGKCIMYNELWQLTYEGSNFYLNHISSFQDGESE